MRKKSGRRIKYIVTVLIILCVAAFLFRGSVYRTAVSYKAVGGIKNYTVRDQTLATYIEGHIGENLPEDIDGIVDLTQQIVANALDFSSNIKEIDPSKTVLLKRANDAGYAAFASATGNYLIEKCNLSKIWQARPIRGKLYLFGYDMHKQTKNKSFKDHDFVVFTNKITKREICIDPALFDRFGISRIRKF